MPCLPHELMEEDKSGEGGGGEAAGQAAGTADPPPGDTGGRKIREMA